MIRTVRTALVALVALGIILAALVIVGGVAVPTALSTMVGAALALVAGVLPWATDDAA